MKSCLHFLLIGFVLFAALASMPAYASFAYVAEIRGTINPATSHYLTRAVEEAESAKANFLLVELDTPGGLVSSVREMAQTIDKARVPVVVFTSPAGAAATSAGALLMISSHLAAMSPGANIGAAHPVGAQGEEVKGPMAEKAANDVAAFARSMAALRKRSTTAAELVVLKSKSFSAEEALKENLIDVIAQDRISLLAKIDGRTVTMGTTTTQIDANAETAYRPIAMTIGEQFLHYLSHPNIAAILMTLGILLIYAEINAPTMGIAGILGGLCLIIAFIAFQAVPIRTGGLALVGIGAALVIAEIFVVSGGFLATGGALCLVLGLLWVVDPTATDLRLSPWLVSAVGAVFLSSALVIGIAASRINKLSEETLRRIGGGDAAGVRGYVGRIQTVNADSHSGQVLIRGEIWEFTSQEPLNKDDLVTVKQSNGLKLEVQRS